MIFLKKNWNQSKTFIPHKECLQGLIQTSAHANLHDCFLEKIKTKWGLLQNVKAKLSTFVLGKPCQW